VAAIGHAAPVRRTLKRQLGVAFLTGAAPPDPGPRELRQPGAYADGSGRLGSCTRHTDMITRRLPSHRPILQQGEPIEQAIAIMMEAHWRSAVHPDRIEGIGAFNEDREPDFQDPDH
jgi:hypothetical protein